jgi:hypothetical protein
MKESCHFEENRVHFLFRERVWKRRKRLPARPTHGSLFPADPAFYVRHQLPHFAEAQEFYLAPAQE